MSHYISITHPVQTVKSSMPGLCQLSGCCMAPLLFRCEGGGQGDDDQLSHGDQLESSHVAKSQGSRLVEEVSVLVRDNEKYYHPKDPLDRHKMSMF